METKSTKQRLDELYDLLKSEYITENEFRSARSNILRESGFDLSPAPRIRRDRDAEVTHEERRALQSPERGGCGCGCFLMTLFLIVAIALGVAFAVPEWPDRLGGAWVRTAKEQVTELWTSFFPPDAPSTVPDPVPPRDVPRPVIESADPAVGAPAPVEPEPVVPDKPASEEPAVAPEPEAKPDPAQPDANPEENPTTPTDAPDSAMLPSPNLDLPELPDNTLSGPPATTGEPDVTVVEIPPSTPSSGTADAPSAAPPASPTGNGRVVYGVISANSARIRSTPDATIRTNVVGWGRNGDRFSVLEEGLDKSGAKWYRVRYPEGNKAGWISASLVKLEK